MKNIEETDNYINIDFSENEQIVIMKMCRYFLSNEYKLKLFHKRFNSVNVNDTSLERLRLLMINIFNHLD